MKSKEINACIQSKILGGYKTPHGTSQIVLYKEDGKYYLAAFVFLYSREDIESGTVDRPSLWAIADVGTGDIVKKFETSERDFSAADYDVKYNIRTDGQYDTSSEYYERAFRILDEVREALIEKGIFLKDRYKEYLDMIIANIPHEYQRFYYDLSVDVDDSDKKEEDVMDVDKNLDVGENVQECSEPIQERETTAKQEGTATESSVQGTEKSAKSDEPDVILAAIEELQKTFKEKLLLDQHKDQLIDKLHDEVVQYQNGVVNKVVDTMAIDIIQLADNVRKTRAVYAEKEPNAENFTKLLRVVKGLYEDLQDILYRQGIEPYTVEGHDVDARRQTIIASISTDDEKKHNKIAARTAEGYEREDGSVLRRERVKIFKY